MNQIELVGRVIAKPEMVEANSGFKYTKILLEVPKYFQTADQLETEVFELVAWKSCAEEIISKYKKDCFVAVKGRVQVRTNQGNNGSTFYNYDLVAEKLVFY